MSLSRFYKYNQSFKPDSILPKEKQFKKEQLWEEGTIPAEPEAIETKESVEPEQNREETIPEEEIQEPEIEPPTPQPVPEIDIESIRNEAFASGIDMGRKEAEKDFEDGINTLLNICNELDKLRETILRNSVSEMKELVLNISEKIIRHSVAEQEETILTTIKDAIRLAVKSDEIQIQINPQDLQSIKDNKQTIIDSISGLENIVLQADPTIERGGCKLESSCCTVDATLTNQIKIIRDNVMAPDTTTHSTP